MALLFDNDLVDLTVDAPQPDRAHAEEIAAAYAALTRGAGTIEEGFVPLYDGGGVERWATAGRGGFVSVDGRLESVPGDDLGLFWHTEPAPPDFVLRLEWLRWRHEDASGVFVRFPRPSAGPEGNPAFTAIQQGFEVQIDEVGLPGASAIHRTGAIFDQRGQGLRPVASRPAAEWNEFEITVRGQSYAVRLNGRPVTDFANGDPRRGRPTTAAAPSFIGLQIYPGSRVAFRRIRIKAL